MYRRCMHIAEGDTSSHALLRRGRRPVAEMTGTHRGGRFLGYFRRRGDVAPDDGCVSLTQANNWRPESKQVLPCRSRSSKTQFEPKLTTS
jgi:hypothetical protein